MKEINIKEIENIHIGQVEDREGGTGLTVFISECGMCAGVDVRGGGPASRETELAKPLTSAQEINAVVFGGGSAFGLDAAGGVQQYLEEREIGYDVVVTKVPLVCQADLFDLTVGSYKARPDKAMGYAAAKAAMEENNYKDGCYGAGCGATVGKVCGIERCTKSGIGSYAIQIGQLKVGAVVAVNSLGDIYDFHTGKKIAGLLNEDFTGFASTEDVLFKDIEQVENRFVEHQNTALGIIITNGKFDKSKLCKIAGMAHDGFARCINPVHTTADGDSIYAVSVGDVNADLDLTGSLAAYVMSEAIINAVENADSCFGIPSIKDFKF